MATIRPRLGELLQARGLCTRAQLLEAWEAKVLYGDRLGTNLLALGLVDEPTLARVLGEQHGVHSGYGNVIKVDAAAVQLVPKAIAEQRNVVPHHVGDKQLFLLMKDPNDAVAIDEVRFATGLKVMPVVVCEARIWELLARHYGVNASMRPVPLDTPLHVRHRGARRASADLNDPTATTPTSELTSEEDFHQLYAGMNGPSPPSLAFEPIETRIETRPASLREARVETANAPAPPPPVHAPIPGFDGLVGVVGGDGGDGGDGVDATNPGRPLALLARRDPAGSASLLAPPRTRESLEWRDTIEKTNPMLALPRVVIEDGKPRILDEDEEPGGPPIIDLVEVAEPIRQETLNFHIEIKDVVDDTPLSFADASEMLRGAGDRNAIAKVVLRAARTRFARACLLTVYSDRLVGWMGLGEGVETDRLRGIVLPRTERSVFALVVESRAHYLGPLAKYPAHGGWVKATGRQIPLSLAVLPILVRGRPVNVLVVDNGHDRHVGSDVGELLILAQQIAKTYETLLRSS